MRNWKIPHKFYSDFPFTYLGFTAMDKGGTMLNDGVGPASMWQENK